jgi:hypothetical protein
MLAITHVQAHRESDADADAVLQGCLNALSFGFLH